MDVPIINDDILEDTESFTTNFTTSDSAVTLNLDLAQVDIFEDPNDGNNIYNYYYNKLVITTLEVLPTTSLVPSPTLGKWVWLPAYSKLGQHYVSGPRSGPAM